jgi:hypothetical protein
MTKIAGSGSISQKHGSEDPDPDPPQNVMDPEHCLEPSNLPEYLHSTSGSIREHVGGGGREYRGAQGQSPCQNTFK